MIGGRVSDGWRLVSRGQTLFRAGRYRLQYKHPLSEGQAQFTGLKFASAISDRRVLINPHDQLSTTYNFNFHSRYVSMSEHGAMVAERGQPPGRPRLSK